VICLAYAILGLEVEARVLMSDARHIGVKMMKKMIKAIVIVLIMVSSSGLVGLGSAQSPPRS